MRRLGEEETGRLKAGLQNAKARESGTGLYPSLPALSGLPRIHPRHGSLSWTPVPQEQGNFTGRDYEPKARAEARTTNDEPSLTA